MNTTPQSFPSSVGQRNPDSPAALLKRVQDLERRLGALDGEQAISGVDDLPVNPLHVAAAEDEAQQKAAVNYAMVSQSLNYADAVKWVGAHGGAAQVLQDRDAAPVLQGGPALQGRLGINEQAVPAKNADWLNKPAKKA